MKRENGATPDRPLWAIRAPEQLADFFLESEEESARPFAKNAVEIGHAMEQVARELRSRTTGDQSIDEKLELSLPVQSGGIGVRLYKEDMTQAHLDLFEGVYAMTAAEQISPGLDPETSTGPIWLQGRFNLDGRDFPMNFIEVHGRDETGDFVHWLLVTDVPEPLIELKSEAVAAHIEPIAEIRQLEFDMHRGLREVGTVPVDETAQVRAWDEQQAA